MTFDKESSKIFRVAAIIYAGLLYICILSSSLLLEITHGRVTPNGNRYGCISFFEIDWITFILMNVAYILLLLPWLKYSLEKNRKLFSLGIFPATSTLAKVMSVLLTLFSIITGLIFTILHLIFCIRRIGGIILEDERIFIIFAYFACIFFWGTVCLLYKITFKNW